MSSATIMLDKQLRDYLLNVSVRESEVLYALRKETENMEYSQMQISPEQGSFMAFLVGLINGKRTLDIGVFTGYSALVVASALPENGYVTACDINTEWTDIAKKYWELANVENKIDLRIAPALETLDGLLSDGCRDRYDFSFIDADKINYQHYYERSLMLLRPGGLIAIDNVLWSGRIIENHSEDPDTEAIKEFNKNLYQDERVSISMVPIGDGLTLVRKL
jgi:caffeoyl-CoA O-methyltransferase